MKTWLSNMHCFSLQSLDAKKGVSTKQNFGEVWFGKRHGLGRWRGWKHGNATSLHFVFRFSPWKEGINAHLQNPSPLLCLLSFQCSLAFIRNPMQQMTCWKTIGSEERLRDQKHIDHTSMWTMLGVRYPTPLQPCSLFPSLYHHINKPYGITIFLPLYSNMFVVLTYLKSTYVFDCLQHLSSTLFLISTTPLSMFHLHHNLQHSHFASNLRLPIPCFL